MNETFDTSIDSDSNPTDTVLNLDKPGVVYDTISENEFRAFFRFTEAKYYNLHNDPGLMNLLNDSTRVVWRRKRLNFNGQFKTPEIWGYPLSYKVLNENIFRVTTITEGEAGNIIIAFTFNRNYDRIGTEILSSVGGDQGDVWRTGGEFINDSTFMLNVMSYSSDDSTATKRLYRQCIRFRANGQIEKYENCY